MKKEKIEYSNWQFVKDLWHFFKIHKGEFIFFSLFLVVSALLGLVPPIVLAKIIDFFIEGGTSVKAFYYLFGILFVVTVSTSLIQRIGKYYLSLFANKIQKHAKVESFQKIMEGDLVWHDKENTGNKMQRVYEGGSAIGHFMNFYKDKGVNIVIKLIGIVVIFAIFNLKYALLAILYIVVYLYFEHLMNKRLVKKTIDVKIAREKSAGKSYEFSSNISTIKSLGIEKSSNNQILDSEEMVFQAQNQRRKATALKWTAVQLVAILFFLLFIFLVGKDIFIGVLTIGSIVIYVQYLGELKILLNSISSSASELIDMKYSLYRLMEIYRTIPDIDEDGAKNLKSWNEISIKDLGFKYKDEGILKNFSLNIKRGEKIGIVGKSGSGKSTLFKLLLKLYLPKKGMIYFDKKPVTGLKRESILDKISVVPQEIEVFNLSLRENIIISSEGRINYNKYKKALAISQVFEYLSKMKKGDLSLIGEKGVRLSGGEKQRLGIARAIYKDSDVIIFDEATSNLDYATEMKIQKGLDKLKGKTLIISAHRLSTLRNMDKILFMSKGKIVEQGTYDELLKKRGEFYKLWKKQEGK
jgi:ATP-binding cassette, subfamily B, bacterial